MSYWLLLFTENDITTTLWYADPYDKKWHIQMDDLDAQKH